MKEGVRMAVSDVARYWSQIIYNLMIQNNWSMDQAAEHVRPQIAYKHRVTILAAAKGHLRCLLSDPTPTEKQK